MILFATAPIQIVVASKAQPSAWVPAASSAAGAIAALGALGAAYFSRQQADQVGQTRRADHLIPVLDDLERHIGELQVAQYQVIHLADLIPLPDPSPGRKRLDRLSEANARLDRLTFAGGEVIALANKLPNEDFQDTWRSALSLGLEAMSLSANCRSRLPTSGDTTEIVDAVRNAEPGISALINDLRGKIQESRLDLIK